MKKIILLAALLVGSASMACASGSHEGGHHMEEKHWTAPHEAAQQENPVPPDSNSISEGSKLFAELCARCHGPQAQGNGPDASGLSVKPTDLKAMAGGHPDGDFAWKIKNGRGEMPAWEDELEKIEVWHLVNYVQSLKVQSPAKKSTHEHGHD
ncbi:c-type cytochrome [Desulforhopalus sp. IMCC35007]|uniref:c-type cytochrome n=1 Tax=Desulforhopalus sp. IMCC35007 TaxID=2569543 RepID=UPI0010AE554A|nr:c-type cytochrome [Desulforhopalus sp. IMCC35007]TKB11314.1 c-type cytochrome [Desulforhopalus sp. IMCC35007]